MSLSGRIAIVIGSDSGIGQATAVALAEAGADVAVTFHTDRDGAADTCRRIEAVDRRCLLHCTDVRDPASVATLFAAVREELGPPGILVSCAAIGGPETEVPETDPAAWDDTIRTNLSGAFHCCRSFARMRRQAGGRGKIVIVTSVREATPGPGLAAYGAAKGGLLVLVRSLALELAKDRINVNAVAPGLIRTPMTESELADPEVRARKLAAIPWGRAGEPEEVARLILWLAGDEADYVTGQSFVIDGGLMLNWGQMP